MAKTNNQYAQLITSSDSSNEWQSTSSNNQQQTSSSYQVALPAQSSQTNQTATSKKRQIGSAIQSRFKFNGYLSAGFAGSTASNGADYNIPEHGAIANNIRFGNSTLAGIQMTVDVFTGITAVVQVVATGSDINGDRPYRPQFDWAYLRYRPNKSIQVRTGRFRSPLLLYSETIDVGYTYYWAFLPNTVYRVIPFYNVNGIDTEYVVSIFDSGWNLSIKPFFGSNTNYLDLYTNTTATTGTFVLLGTTATLHEDYLSGIVISFGNQYFKLQGGFAYSKITGDVPTTHVGLGASTTSATTTLFTDSRSLFYTGGIKLDYNNFIIQGEIAARVIGSNLASLVGFYGSIGYRFNGFMPNLTYGHISTTNTSRLNTLGDELPQAENDYSVGLTYYINQHLSTKGQLSVISPTASTNGLFTSNPGSTYIFVYAISLNAIF